MVTRARSCALPIGSQAAARATNGPALQTGIFPYPAFVRGEVYLREGKGREAAAEFQKYVEHRGATVNCQLGALARLQLGRSFGLAGEMDKARAAYQDFLTLWKDSRPRHPRLEARKAEYAKLG